MIPTEFDRQLVALLGKDAVLQDPGECWVYGYDNSRRHAVPERVALPQSHAHVRDIVRLCNQFQIPFLARGRGTGTTGATVPVQGGLVLSLERMNRIQSVDPANRAIVVEPGVTNQAVQDSAAAHGFFWPPDPTSAAFCTVGGNLAYNSAGPRAVKYGTCRENTLGLRAVTGSGDELRTGVYTTKGVVGYDLTRLIIGSEGTLALITEATLRLTPLPEAKHTFQAVYNTVESAAAAVSAIMAQPVVPCALEFMDQRAIDMIRSYSGAPLPVGAAALLMIEVDGLAEAMDAATERVITAARNDGLVDITVAQSRAEVEAMWQTRKALSPALRNVAPKKINEDVVVPVSEIPRLMTGLRELEFRHKVTIVNFGHAGNGNIHVNLLVNPDDVQEMIRAAACLDEVFSLVLRLRGTLSGEHGVGLEKRDFIARELDPVALSLMRKIKQQFDPLGLLNRGKLLP